jgi:hypothetical protein
MSYFYTNNGFIVNQNNEVIPQIEGNPLYQDYLIWLRNGGEVLPTDFEIEIVEVPQVISRRQFKIALAVLGKNEQDILSGIEQLPEPQRTIARISYTEAGTFERYNPELIAVSTMFLQMNEDDIDEVFKIGSQY